MGVTWGHEMTMNAKWVPNPTATVGFGTDLCPGRGHRLGRRWLHGG